MLEDIYCDLTLLVISKHLTKYRIACEACQRDPDLDGIAIAVWVRGSKQKSLTYCCFSGQDMRLNRGGNIARLVAARVKYCLGEIGRKMPGLIRQIRRDAYANPTPQ